MRSTFSSRWGCCACLRDGVRDAAPGGAHGGREPVGAGDAGGVFAGDRSDDDFGVRGLWVGGGVSGEGVARVRPVHRPAEQAAQSRRVRRAMTVVHRITGYDKRRGNLMVEHDVPQDKMRRIKDLANVEKRDDAAVGSYELAPDQAKKIARAINKMINVEGYIWFLEPFGE